MQYSVIILALNEDEVVWENDYIEKMRGKGKSLGHKNIFEAEGND